MYCDVRSTEFIAGLSASVALTVSLVVRDGRLPTLTTTLLSVGSMVLPPPPPQLESPSPMSEPIPSETRRDPVVALRIAVPRKLKIEHHPLHVGGQRRWRRRWRSFGAVRRRAGRR